MNLNSCSSLHPFHGPSYSACDDFSDFEIHSLIYAASAAAAGPAPVSIVLQQVAVLAFTASRPFYGSACVLVYFVDPRLAAVAICSLRSHKSIRTRVTCSPLNARQPYI